MTSRARAVRISKRMALALRHDPAALGVTLDAAGWTSIDELVRGLAARGVTTSRDEVEAIVETSDKQRFAISADGERIRANQGHSVAVDLGLPPREPPETLYHGTALRFLPSIREHGLVRGARTHVHLSADTKTAEIVAARRAGERVVLRVRAGEMHRAGHVFWVSDNGVWLVKAVPASFLEI
jgi:putative RNA 2'-phosphotransferase